MFPKEQPEKGGCVFTYAFTLLTSPFRVYREAPAHWPGSALADRSFLPEAESAGVGKYSFWVQIICH